MKFFRILLAYSVFAFLNLTVQGMTPRALYFMQQVQRDPDLQNKLKPILEDGIKYGQELMTEIQKITQQISNYTTLGRALWNQGQTALTENNLANANKRAQEFWNLDETLKVNEIVLAIIRNNKTLFEELEKVYPIMETPGTKTKANLEKALLYGDNALNALNNANAHLSEQIKMANSILTDAKRALSQNNFSESLKLADKFSKIEEEESIAGAMIGVLWQNKQLAKKREDFKHDSFSLVDVEILKAVKKRLNQRDEVTKNKFGQVLPGTMTVGKKIITTLQRQNDPALKQDLDTANSILGELEKSLRSNNISKAFDHAIELGDLRKHESVAVAIGSILSLPQNKALAEELTDANKNFDDLVNKIIEDAITPEATTPTPISSTPTDTSKKISEITSLFNRFVAFAKKSNGNQDDAYIKTARNWVTSAIYEKNAELYSEAVLHLGEFCNHIESSAERMEKALLEMDKSDISLREKFKTAIAECKQLAGVKTSNPLSDKLQALQKSLTMLKTKLTQLSTSLGQLKVKLNKK